MNSVDLYRRILRLQKELNAAKAEAEEWKEVALQGQAIIERLRARVAELLRKKRGH